jgi:hypothetical protein
MHRSARPAFLIPLGVSLPTQKCVQRPQRRASLGLAVAARLPSTPPAVRWGLQHAGDTLRAPVAAASARLRCSTASAKTTQQPCACNRAPPGCHGDRSTPPRKLGARYRHGAGPPKKCLQASPSRDAASTLRSRKTQLPCTSTCPAPRARVGLSQGACVRQPQCTRCSARQPDGAGPPRQQHDQPGGYQWRGRHGGASARGVRHLCARRCGARLAAALR